MRVAVIGGCGHVGLPLAISLADAGLPTVSYDLDPEAVAVVNSGMMPFLEPGADEVLTRVLAEGTFWATTSADSLAGVEVVIVVIGTPVDEHLNPDPNAVVFALQDIGEHLRDGQLLILRSTVFPGVTARVERSLAEHGFDIDVAFCPERIAEGKAMAELHSLPQLVGARNPEVHARAAAVFESLGVEAVAVTPEEAELAKLMTNAWRYIKFAAANQFWIMANNAGLDFSRIQRALSYDYPRAADMPGAGFAAGPCLLKDTMQLAAFSNNSFALGHTAMLVNEGLPLYIVERVERDYELSNMTVGILGMAFKGGSDDVRSSLSYKLRRILLFRAANVVCGDSFVTSDPRLIDESEVLAQADLIIIGAPHPHYRELATATPLVDVWGLRGEGNLL